mgnify:CR=1 FL=1
MPSANPGSRSRQDGSVLAPRGRSSIAGAVVGSAGSLTPGAGHPCSSAWPAYGLGGRYDLGLQRTAWGWACFALALPLVPDLCLARCRRRGLPPDVGTLILLGGLAGTELAVANGLVDVTTDSDVGTGRYRRAAEPDAGAPW